MKNDKDPKRQLELERQRFNDFQRATSEWTWETDIDHRFTYMSTNVFEVTGIAPEWHYGKSREDIGIREEMGETAWLAFQDILRKREPFLDLIYARRGPSSVTWVHTSGVPYFENEVFQGYRGSGRIVTKEIETAQLAAQLTAGIENMSDYFSLWDANDRLIFCNKAFREINSAVPGITELGIPFEDHMRALFDAGETPESAQTFEDSLKQRMLNHRNPTTSFEFERSDGITVLVNETKLPDGSTSVCTANIDRLKQAEKDSADKAEIVETAFRTIPDGIVVLAPDGTPITWNDHLFTIFGITPLKEIDPDELRPTLLSVIAQQIGAGGSETDVSDISSLIHAPHQHNQQEFRLADNKWVEFRGSPMAGGGYLMTFRDFTERNDLDRLKSQFVSTISHELRTPLTSIIGSMGLVNGGAGGDIPEDARNLIKIGINNGERLLNLINDILDLEKISQDEFELDLATMSMGNLIDTSMKANLGFAERFKIRLVANRGDEDYFVIGDNQRLMQVMDNLLSNAIKFSSANDEVEVMLSARGPNVRVSVTDRGPGVAKKFQKTIFDRFVQVDSSDTRSIAGTGLGLNICKGIVLKHGGEINLHSTPTVGSTFYFELPILKSAPV